MPVLFHTSCALGIHPSEVLSPVRYPGFSAWKNPPTVDPALLLTHVRQIGLAGLGFWVRASRDCLSTKRRIRPMVIGASLGFCPCRVFERRSCVGLLRRSSHVLSRSCRFRRANLHLRVSIDLHFASPDQYQSITGRGNPLGVLAPARS